MSELKSNGGFYKRFAWVILAGFALLTPVLFFGAGKAVSSNSNKVEDWLPAGSRKPASLAGSANDLPATSSC